MNATSPVLLNGMPFGMQKQIRRIGPLGLIILLHVLFFYALQSGLLRQAAQAMPREIFVSFITPEQPAPIPQPEPPKPVSAPPKTVPVVKKKVKPRPAPVKPAITPTPAPQPIETPIAPAAPSIDPPVAAAPAAPPAPAVPALPKTISGVEYIRAPLPDYPPISKRMGEEGKVILRVLVNEKGLPERVDVRQSSGSARLDEAARQAALRALFKPHLEDGRPVAVYALVPIDFSIQ
jgi:protein TonB